MLSIVKILLYESFMEFYLDNCRFIFVIQLRLSFVLCLHFWHSQMPDPEQFIIYHILYN